MASSSSSSPELPVSRSTANGQPSLSVEARLHEVLEDLSSRFILNLPEVELASLERVCFQVEQAHWYYEDFVREQDPSLPTMTLKKFSHSLFHVCPLLSHWGDDHEQTFQNFMAYKTRVPVCGAIMLNDTWDKCLLVKGWKATSAWSFPKGKINEQEPRHRCAVREVLEETGYDLSEQINPANVVELSIRDQSLSLYIVPNVPEDYEFETRTRKEISKIAWFKLQDLPTWRRNKPVPGKFYLITPFIGPLKAFIRDHKPKDLNRRNRRRSHAPAEADAHLSSGDDARHTGESQDAATAAQESSSQSSADQGDPQTPSPLYSEPVVHHAAQDDNNTQQTLNLDSVDPHFARLLTSLSLSASASSTEDVQKGQNNEHPPAQFIATPSTVEELGRFGTRSPSQAGTARPPRTPSAATAVSPPPAYSHARKPSRTIASPSPLRHVSSDVHLRSSATGADVQPSAIARRAAADLSPYLQRTSATPAAIPKQMKYISMLESLAKDSERMTPKIERQQAVLASMGGPSLPAREQFGAPGPLNSMYGIREESPVIYSSGPGHSSSTLDYASQASLPPFPSVHQAIARDPFTVRPHTSNNFHAPYPMPSRPAFNEQLGGMVPGNGVRPSLGLPMVSQPISFPANRVPGPPGPFPAPQPFTANRMPPNQQALHLIPPGQLIPSTEYNEPVPLSAPAVSSTFNLSRANPANNAHLLSILNGTAAPRDPAFVNVGLR